MEPNRFEALLARIRDGDSEAAGELIDHFEPEIRRVARVRLRDPRLQSIADSIDVSQSVFGRFFQKYVRSGQIETEAQALALLVTMTKNRLSDLARKHKPPAVGSAPPTAAIGAHGAGYESGRRPPLAVAREVTQLGELDAIVEARGPSTVVASADLAEQIRRRLSRAEYDLVNRRNEGESWDEIAAAIGKSPDALRKQLRRALDRVRGELDDESLSM